MASIFDNNDIPNESISIGTVGATATGAAEPSKYSYLAIIFVVIVGAIIVLHIMYGLDNVMEYIKHEFDIFTTWVKAKVDEVKVKANTKAKAKATAAPDTVAPAAPVDTTTTPATVAAATVATNQQNETSEFNELINNPPPANNGYQASDAHSTLTKGWCFVGEYKGYRTCENVVSSDKCMSGNIFPTKEICVNPSLRL